MLRTLLAGFILGFGSVGLIGQQQPRNLPSLSDTEQWIRSTFNNENTGQSACNEFASMDQPVTGADYGPLFSCINQSYSLEFEGCKATLYTFNSHTHSPCGDARVPSGSCKNGDDKERDTVVRFNLGDIDPKTIQAQEPWGSFGPLGKRTFHANRPQVSVSLSTTNSQDTMLLFLPYSRNRSGPAKIHELGGNWNFITVQPDYAPRFIKAFTHAVELCGGKPSAF